MGGDEVTGIGSKAGNRGKTTSSSDTLWMLLKGLLVVAVLTGLVLTFVNYRTNNTNSREISRIRRHMEAYGVEIDNPTLIEAFAPDDDDDDDALSTSELDTDDDDDDADDDEDDDDATTTTTADDDADDDDDDVTTATTTADDDEDDDTTTTTDAK